MKSIISGTSSLALALAPFAFIGSMAVPLTAANANPSEDYCYETGGIQYHKDGPNSWCEYPIEKPGNNPPGEQGSESQDTLSGHGNIGNKTQSGCDGNKGQCRK